MSEDTKEIVIEPRDVFKKLYSTKIEVGNNQGKKYVKWNNAWATLLKAYPTATYKFHEKDGLPFFNSELGLFVKVSVTIEDITHTMSRPVYNNAMKSMRIEPYSYITKNGEKQVEGANASDVNDALMRCLTKAIAMHGLGLFVFEDKPYADAELLGSAELNEITKLLSDYKLNLFELTSAYGISSLAELHLSSVAGAIELLDSVHNKQTTIKDYIQVLNNENKSN